MTDKALNSGPEGKDTTLDVVIKHFGDRPLRVAIMCSGTESPILTLRLIQQSLQRAGKQGIQFEHVVSAENNHLSKTISNGTFHHLFSFRTSPSSTSLKTRTLTSRQ